jgi:hypothetical protein
VTVEELAGGEPLAKTPPPTPIAGVLLDVLWEAAEKQGLVGKRTGSPEDAQVLADILSGVGAEGSQ